VLRAAPTTYSGQCRVDPGLISKNYRSAERSDGEEASRRIIARYEYGASLVTNHDLRYCVIGADVAATKARRRETEKGSGICNVDGYARIHGRMSTQNRFRWVVVAGDRIRVVCIHEDDIALVPRAAAGRISVHRVTAGADSDIGLRPCGLAACELKARVQIVGRACHAAVLRELREIRNADRHYNADYQHRYEKFVEREAALGSFFHACNILRGFHDQWSIRQMASSGR
jgi:hypothetical protein